MAQKKLNAYVFHNQLIKINKHSLLFLYIFITPPFKDT